MARRFVRAAIAGVLIALWPATAAWAHVSVTPSEAQQGSFEKITFGVPNEQETGNTTQVQITIPDGVTIPSVSVEPVPGWTNSVETRKLSAPVKTDDGEVSEVVSSITWTGGQIKPGEFQDFTISAGPLPDVDKIEFKALQTYDDGTVVRWIETQEPGGPEPEHPAPTLTLTKASGGGDHGSDSASSESSSSSSDDDSNALAIVALVVGGLGLIVGGVALVRSRGHVTPTS